MLNKPVLAAAEGMPQRYSIKPDLSCDILNLSHLLDAMTAIILEMDPPEGPDFNRVMGLSIIGRDISQSLHQKIEDNYQHLSVRASCDASLPEQGRV